MTILNWSNIPKITNQIKVSPPPQNQTSFRYDASSKQTQRSAPLLHLDLSDRKGYREDYSIRDAAESLWKQETQTFNLKDLSDPAKASVIIENMRLGVNTGEAKEKAISAYIQNLRQSGLNGDVNWSGLSRELEAFKAATPEELADGLDYLASRYTAVLDKLERNCQGEELIAQRAKLEEIYEAGKSGMIDGYTQLLQDNLGISNNDAQAIKDSFSTILTEKVNAYREALTKVHETISQTGADSVWLKNHDAYIASQLRAEGTTTQSQALYSVQDLTIAGQIAKSYQSEIFSASLGNRNEATLALNLSMADMKAETMISKGLIGKNMADLLRGSRSQGHENALTKLDQTLAQRESSLLSGEPKGTFAPIDRTVFQEIYTTVMNAYQQNGGDGVGAIRAGAAYGQTVTTRATAKNPNALRWGLGIDSYWKNFYTTPQQRENSVLQQHISQLLKQTGLSDKSINSTYQNYVNDWQGFLTSISQK